MARVVAPRAVLLLSPGANGYDVNRRRRGAKKDGGMKIAGNVIGALFLLIGIVWCLQGLNLLGGSFMTGQMDWFYIGGVTGLVGATLLILNNSSRNRN
jgi:hypothetical protein